LPGGALMPQQTIVYTGPTLSPDEVLAVLPEAQVRPPLARADLLAEDWAAGDIAVIIDGFFRERRSVGHKDILWLLAEGVQVVGAASMGALRAAEMAAYGMLGVGVVYTMYATEEIDGDDEVGVLHGPADRGYQAQTVALVNLRYGCRRGAETGLVPEAAGRRIVQAAKELPFIQRSWPEIASRLDERDRPVLDRLAERIGSGAWDIKRLDALSALRGIATGQRTSPAAGSIEAAALTGIAHGRVLASRSLSAEAHGQRISELEVLDAARLFDAEYPRLHEEVLSGLLDGFAAAEGMTVAAYGQAKLGVDGSSPLPDRLADWLSPAELELSPEQRLQRIMVRVWPVWHSTDWRPAVLARLRSSSRWQEWVDIVGQAQQAAEQARYRLVVPPPAVGGKLFLRHWREPGMSTELEMARRGFFSHEELGRAVEGFFALDMQRHRAQARSAQLARAAG
ncbi:MAG TPA: TfuA-like protein, partial [Jatrophihabitans sp.]|nr:TfuA-like protein [Jatrophihabitans sp.]